MIVSIIIEGDSAEELFAVGPNDLKQHHFPRAMGIKAEDITQIAFKEVTERDEDGLPTKYSVHRDNFFRQPHTEQPSKEKTS